LPIDRVNVCPDRVVGPSKACAINSSGIERRRLSQRPGAVTMNAFTLEGRMGMKLTSSSARHLLSALATAVVLAGCSSNDQLGGRGGSGGGAAGSGGDTANGGTGGGGMGGTAGGGPAAMFASDFEAAYCTPLVTCAVFPDLATCEAFMDFAEDAQIITTVGAIGRGTVVYDPTAAAACLTAVSQDCTVNSADAYMTIDQMSALHAFFATPACSGVFTGTLPPGAACDAAFSMECAAPQSDCSPVVGVCNGACCPGVCAAPPSNPVPHALGEDCTDNDACALPAVCQGSCVVPPGHLAACASTQFPCAYLADYCGEAPGANSATCLPRLAPGTPCTVEASTIDPCVMDAHCAPNAAGDDVCIPLVGLGETCDATANPCVRSLSCTNGTCIPTLTPGTDCGG
jgi:hypothetical protein